MTESDLIQAGLIGLGAGGLVALVNAMRGKPKPPPEPPLLWITPNDPLTLHQAYEGILAMGGTGSGKSSTFAHLLRALMERDVGMLILTAKASDASEILAVARSAGREGDVRLFEPGGPFRFNFLDFELNSRGGSIASASQMLADLVDFSMKASSQKSNEPFWPMASARSLRMALQIIHHATGTCDVESLYRFVTSFPANRDSLISPEWRDRSFCSRMLLHAESMGETPDVSMAGDYVLQEWPSLGERTAGSIQANTINTLEKFLTGPARELVGSGESNLTPDDILDGRIVVVNTPALVFREPGRFIQLAWKLATVQAVLRRDLAVNPRPVCIWADEAQLHACPADSMVQAVARSHRLINVAITQNIPLLQAAMGDKEQAMAWLANLVTKFIFSNTDRETNEYFSSQLGQSKQLFMSGNQPTGPADLLGEWMGQEEKQGSAGFSEQMLADVLPEHFGSKLRKGGAENGLMVDAYVFQGGRRFSNGKAWVKGSFRQA
ncbi:MAG: TraM recognition domain-containing protein [Planctomycetes bacterium]|nr:TraM recognition domain-containing protein [Planctomycetota bacterium]